MNKRQSQGNAVQSVENVFDIIEALQELDGAGITELAKHVELAKSTIHNHLMTLEQRAYVVKEDDQYRLSLRFLGLGEYTKYRRDVVSMVKPMLEELAEETGERVQFVVPEHAYGFYVHIATGEHAVRTGVGIGTQRSNHLHATAAGKSAMAYVSERRLHRILEMNGLPRLTSNTITTDERFQSELDVIRERGYALNNEEHIEGLRAVGVPVLSPTEELLGAISLSAPTRRLKGSKFESEIPDLLLGITNELKLNMQYP